MCNAVLIVSQPELIALLLEHLGSAGKPPSANHCLPSIDRKEKCVPKVLEEVVLRLSPRPSSKPKIFKDFKEAPIFVDFSGSGLSVVL